MNTLRGKKKITMKTRIKVTKVSECVCVCGWCKTNLVLNRYGHSSDHQELYAILNLAHWDHFTSLYFGGNTRHHLGSRNSIQKERYIFIKVSFLEMGTDHSMWRSELIIVLVIL